MPLGDLDRQLLLLTLRIGVIIGASRLLGVLMRSIGQPSVMGELIAGLLLGPSFLGWMAPGLSAALFPAAALPQLKLLAELGIVLFMFLIGLELNPRPGLRRLAVLRDRRGEISQNLLGEVHGQKEHGDEVFELLDQLATEAAGPPHHGAHEEAAEDRVNADPLCGQRAGQEQNQDDGRSSSSTSGSTSASSIRSDTFGPTGELVSRRSSGRRDTSDGRHLRARSTPRPPSRGRS